MLTLLDVFRAFPDGMSGLAAAVDVNLKTLYKVVGGYHAKPPVRILETVATTFRKRKVPVKGQDVTSEWLLTLWDAARVKRAGK